MDTLDNRLRFLEEKIKILEDLSRCSVCRNIESLICCSSCYAKVCDNCNITKERSVSKGGVEFIILCRTCSYL